MRRSVQLARSLSASLATTALDVGLFTAAASVLPKRAHFGARLGASLAGAVANFALNRRAFQAREGERSVQGARYAVVALAAIALGTLMWSLMVSSLRIDPRLAHPLSLALVWLTLTFPAMRSWVYRQ